MAEIVLADGSVALVDDEDLEWLNARRWSFHTSRANRSRYAKATRREGDPPGGVHIAMHRLILGAQPGQFVDHVNGNGLDNRRANLRLCSQSQNSSNYVRTYRKKNPYRGVNKAKPGKGWIANITANREHHYLGYFSTPEEAAHAYDAAAKQHHGEFAVLNFPD